ncbi:MAG: hypothetical protein ACTSU5_18980 [Promethearchaeota archaeon]
METTSGDEPARSVPTLTPLTTSRGNREPTGTCTPVPPFSASSFVDSDGTSDSAPARLARLCHGRSTPFRSREPARPRLDTRPVLIEFTTAPISSFWNARATTGDHLLAAGD